MPPRLDGKIRRHYVLWREYITPTIALEFASFDGSEERDRSAAIAFYLGRGSLRLGSFWVYERIMHIPFYGIYEVNNGKLEVYHLIEGVYQKMATKRHSNKASDKGGSILATVWMWDKASGETS